MDISIEILIASVIVALGVGALVGGVVADRYWVNKASEAAPQYRTAIHSGGKFYYVIPESEFVREWRHKDDEPVADFYDPPITS